jgi:hypothetical protein
LIFINLYGFGLISFLAITYCDCEILIPYFLLPTSL